MFSNTNKPAFGATTNLFGQPAGTSTGLFGKPAVSFSVGTTQPANVGLFSGTTTNLFATPNPTGTTGLFGANQATNPGTTTFGQPATNTGLFGTSTVQKPLFGATTSTGFGTTTSTGGLFGTSTANTNLFGTTTQSGTGGLFGQQNTGTTGLFGTTSPMPNGTAAVKFNSVKGTDSMMKNNLNQTIQTSHQCITAMKEYEQKSLEELRVDDYLAGRKYGTASTTGTGLFGMPAASNAGTGLFGTSTFGTPASSAGASLFSAAAATPVASTGGLFGSNVSRPLFGPTTTTTASTGFNFGTQPAGQTNIFSSTAQPQPTTNLFGQPAASVPQPAFGVPTATQNQPAFGAPSSGFNFTSSQPAATNLFGPKTNLFGTSTTSAPSLFGQPTSAPSFTGFSTTPAVGTTNLFAPKTSAVTFPTFGAPASSAAAFQTGFTGFNTSTAGNLFNAQQQQVRPLTFGSAQPGFGQTTSTSLFGPTSVAPTFGSTTGTNLFTNQTGGSLFGGFNSQPVGQNQQPLSLGTDPNVAAQQAIMQQQAVLALMNSPYGESSLLKNILPQVKRDAQVQPTDPLHQQRLLHTMSNSTLVGCITSSITSTISPRPLVRVQPRLLNTSHNRSSNKSGIFDEDFDTSATADTSLVSKKSVKKLVIKPRKSHVSNEHANSSATADHISLNLTNGHWNSEADRLRPNGTSQSESRGDSAPIFPRLNLSGAQDISANNISPVVPSPGHPPSKVPAELNFLLKPVASRPSITRVAQDDTMALLSAGRGGNVDGSGDMSSAHERTTDISSMQDRSVLVEEIHPAGIILARPEYYTVPSLEALKDFVDTNGNCYVPDGFTVGRHGYGSVFWPNTINVANIDLDKIVHFRHKEVTVYPNESDKPPIGEELNRGAEITLERVWPNDKSDHTPIKSPQRLQLMRYRERLEKITVEMGAKFIDYRPETGSWVFQVSHFSKYGLADEADEEGPTPSELEMLRISQNAAERVQRTKTSRSPQQPILKPPESVQQPIINTVEYNQTRSREDILIAGLGGEDFAMEDIITGEMDISPSVRYYENDEMIEDQTGYEEDFSQRIDQLYSINLSTVAAMRQSFFDTSTEVIEKSAFDLDASASKKHTNLADVLQRSCQLLEKSSKIINTSFPSLSVQKDLNISQMDPIDKRLLSRPKAKVTTTLCVAPKYPLTLLPYADSLLLNRHRCIADASLFHSRQFRVGWGAEKFLYHIGKGLEMQKSPVQRGKGKIQQLEEPFQVSIEKISLYNDYKPEYLEAMLSCQLDGSECQSNLVCPFFAPKASLTTAEQYENLSGQLEDMPVYFRQTWSLCLALWGPLKYFDSMDAMEHPYAYQMARKDSLSKWLMKANDTTVENILKAKSRTINQNERILALLTARRIQEAAEAACENGDLRLSVLLGTLGGCVTARALLLKQLSQWLEVQADVHIDHERMKLFVLLAGILCWKLSDETVTNVCETLDWKRAFGLHFWYHSHPCATIAQIVESYERGYRGSTGHGKYAVQPLPPYLEQDELAFQSLANYSEGRAEVMKSDLLYHLIKLSSDKSHRLEIILNPESHTPPQSSMDYHLSWHLWCVLQALGYSQISELALNRIHIDYAEQLVEAGMWHWAIFVLCHIRNEDLRELRVKSVICQSVEEASDEQLIFVKEKLFIQDEWIYEAKALLAKRKGNPTEECWFCLKAKLWNLAHQIFLDEVGPDIVANEDYEKLRKFIEPLEVNSDQIAAWPIGGQIYWEYLSLCDKFAEIQQMASPTRVNFLAARPILLSLSSRLDGMNCPTPLHRLAQGEMGKRVAVFLRLLTGEAEWISLGEILARLPMPDDYFLQEMKRLALSIGL